MEAGYLLVWDRVWDFREESKILANSIPGQNVHSQTFSQLKIYLHCLNFKTYKKYTLKSFVPNPVYAILTHCGQLLLLVPVFLFLIFASRKSIY